MFWHSTGIGQTGRLTELVKQYRALHALLAEERQNVTKMNLTARSRCQTMQIEWLMDARCHLSLSLSEFSTWADWQKDCVFWRQKDSTSVSHAYNLTEAVLAEMNSIDRMMSRCKSVFSRSRKWGSAILQTISERVHVNKLSGDIWTNLLIPAENAICFDVRR